MEYLQALYFLVKTGAAAAVVWHVAIFDPHTSAVGRGNGITPEGQTVYFEQILLFHSKGQFSRLKLLLFYLVDLFTINCFDELTQNRVKMTQTQNGMDEYY